MSLVLKVNTVDRSAYVNWTTLTKNEGLTKEPDRLEFALLGLAGRTIPQLGDEIELTEDAVVIFGGVITEKEDDLVDGTIVAVRIRCKDYSHTFDRRLVVRTYENQSATDIIQDIIDDFTDGFTYANVEAGLPVLETVKFNYEQPSQCLTKIANLLNRDWYVGYDKDIHFFKASSNPAPFDITDTSDTFEWDTLNFNQNIIELKNKVIVRGGQYKTALGAGDTPDIYEATGVDRVFTQIFRYDNVVVTVNGVSKTIGIDNITDPLTVDVLYNFTEKAIKFRENNKPTAGQTVKIYGDAYIPLIASVRDIASIGVYGQYDHLIIDKSITSVAEAKMRAKAELLKWQDGSWAGSFVTRETGLETGMYLSII